MSEIRGLTLEEVKNIYYGCMQRDFPRSEIKPWFKIERMYRNGEYCAVGATDGEEILGYAFLVERPGVGHMLLDYFAVSESRRGSGIGTELISYLKDNADTDGILVETEDIDVAANEDERIERDRRDRFYLDRGAVKTAIRSRVFGVDYAIFNIPIRTETAESDCRDSLVALYRYMIPGISNLLHVKIR